MGSLLEHNKDSGTVIPGETILSPEIIPLCEPPHPSPPLVNHKGGRWRFSWGEGVENDGSSALIHPAQRYKDCEKA